MLGKEREIDLIAFYDDYARGSKIHGHFVIECNAQKTLGAFHFCTTGNL
jgi:hypothetical protein